MCFASNGISPRLYLLCSRSSESQILVTLWTYTMCPSTHFDSWTKHLAKGWTRKEAPLRSTNISHTSPNAHSRTHSHNNNISHSSLYNTWIWQRMTTSADKWQEVGVVRGRGLLGVHSFLEPSASQWPQIYMHLLITAQHAHCWEEATFWNANLPTTNCFPISCEKNLFEIKWESYVTMCYWVNASCKNPHHQFGN